MAKTGLRAAGFLLLVSVSAQAAPTEFRRSYHYCDPGAVPAEAQALRIVTYNIKSGQFTSLKSVIEAANGMSPDVLALQEVDVETKRSERLDQAGELAKALGLCGEFYASIEEKEGGYYGIALLTRFKPAESDALRLPKATGPIFPEPRGVVRLGLLDAKREIFHVACTHLSLNAKDRIKEATALRQWFSKFKGGRVLLMGDLNSKPDSETLLTLEAPETETELGFTQARVVLGLQPISTFPSFFPYQAIDHFLFSGKWAFQGMEREKSRASDHLALRVEALPE